ncbi:MAG TPA: hypothetical protein VNO52_10625 [Methylomirabilota bacterium]|nr:hypothetical protein [Methylomirabilota bacterium]
MQVIPFIAESAADAVAQIRSQLGADAVVLHVRQLPADGLSRWWKSPRIEVLACKPEPPAGAAEPRADEITELRQELSALKQQLQATPAIGDSGARKHQAAEEPKPAAPPGLRTWRVAEVLEHSGLMPQHASAVLDAIIARHGDHPPASLAEELVLARGALRALWPQMATPGNDTRPHVLIGPPGVGKTTCLCKWLTQARLIEGRTVKVWRLDGATANMAEALSVYCEILGLKAERTWNGAPSEARADLSLIDLPGVDWRNPAALRDLGRQVEGLGPTRVHLVLNAAYEVPVLLAQARAFGALPVEDLIFTHLDEETRWGKIWNVVLGTKIPVRFLSAAQNIPGEFAAATAEKILGRQFPA